VFGVLRARVAEEDTYAYNLSDEMSEIKMTRGTETLASLVYARDADGQVDNTVNKGLLGGEVTEAAYDSNNRLTKSGATAYEYDAANNPTKIGTSTYKYNSADELESGTGATYAYNEVGERTKTTPGTGPATTYGYDQAGNLTSVERPKEGTTSEIKDTYTYNGEELRTSQTISGTTSYIAWDTAESTPLILSDGTNSYIYGVNSIPIEQINTAEKAQYLHHDQAGSTQFIAGETGTTEAAYSYTAYGTVEEHTGTATTLFGYDGQYASSDTGLIYLRAQVYDPATSQFLTVDPLEAITGAPYMYAGDNPINRMDLTGLLESTQSPGELGIPCIYPFCAPPPPVVEALEHGFEKAKESIINAITESNGDEGEAELEEHQEKEAACEQIPTGSKPPRAAYRDLEQETGLSRGELSDALHKLKNDASVPPYANTRIDSEGNVYDEETGENIGNIIDESHG
jgi:RHS repeat-associated protein